MAKFIISLSVLALTVLTACKAGADPEMQSYVSTMIDWQSQWYEPWGSPKSDAYSLEGMAEDMRAVEPPDRIASEHDRYVQALWVLAETTATRELLMAQRHDRRAGAICSPEDTSTLGRLTPLGRACLAEGSAEANLIDAELDWRVALDELGCGPWTGPLTEVSCR